MGHKRSRAVLVGLGAAVGAFAAAAIISATTAPTARVDDLTDIINDVDAELAAGHTAFADASADFAGGTSGVPAGLAAFFEGVDDDLFGVPDDLNVGTVDALTNQPVIGSDVFDFLITPPQVTQPP